MRPRAAITVAITTDAACHHCRERQPRHVVACQRLVYPDRYSVRACDLIGIADIKRDCAQLSA